MTLDEMKTYIAEQLAAIASQRQEAQQRLTQTQHELTGLNFAERAYQDMLNELERRQQPTEEA